MSLLITKSTLPCLLTFIVQHSPISKSNQNVLAVHLLPQHQTTMQCVCVCVRAHVRVYNVHACRECLLSLIQCLFDVKEVPSCQHPTSLLLEENSLTLSAIILDY